MVATRTLLAIAFWSFPTFFILFWMCTRIIAYFVMDAAWNKQDFAGTVMPDDVHPDVLNGFLTGVIDPVFNPESIKYWTMRTHVALAVVMGFICVFQLMPILRKRYMKLHRKLGYLYCALLVPFTIEQCLTLYVVGTLPLGPTPLVVNTISLLLMVPGTALGVWAAKNHKVPLHRACMLLNCAGLYVNPTQRFFWALMSKSKLGGPWSTYDEWLDRTLTPSDWLAITSTCATALAYITIIKPGRAFKGKAA